MNTSGPPLDFSFKGLRNIDDVKKEKPRKGVKRYKRTTSGRYHCTSLRFNNNHMVTVNGIHAVIYELLEQPEKLTWLDLSFNRLTHIPSELATFANLKILYLHGNQLGDLSDVLRPLKLLDELYSLTLHGNPLEERKGYRNKVLVCLPQLKSLDFNNVTSADRKRINERNTKNQKKNHSANHVTYRSHVRAITH